MSHAISETLSAAGDESAAGEVRETTGGTPAESAREERNRVMAEVAARSAGTPTTLGANLRYFLTFPSPLILSTAAVGFSVFRLFYGHWTWWDIPVALGLLAWWPFQEWLIHVYVLHAKPTRYLGLRLDTVFARKHRAHHREPWVANLIFIPERAVVGGLIVVPLLYHAVFAPGLAWTGIATYFILSANYEWCHYLAHSQYRPRGKRLQKVIRLHRLHHFRNENFWYGVSMTFGDTVLTTQPEPAKTEFSSTVLTLGVDEGAKPDRAA